MAADLDEVRLRRAVEKAREQNRTISTNNRLLREELRLVSSRTSRTIKFHNSQKAQVTQAVEQTRLEIETRASEKRAQQMQRPRALRAEIRAMAAANRLLEDEIRLLGRELVSMKRLNESMPIPARTHHSPKARKRIQKRQSVVVQSRNRIDRTPAAPERPPTRQQSFPGGSIESDILSP
jgi:hypothetical protein